MTAARSIDFPQLIGDLERYGIDRIAEHYLGRPSYRTGNEIRWGKKGSVSVRYGNHPKAHSFADYESGEGGDVLDMICHFAGRAKRDVLRHDVQAFLSGDLPMKGREDAPVRQSRKPAGPDPVAIRKTQRARDIWRAAVPVPGTIGEAYLRDHRRISVPIPLSIRFHPRVPHEHLREDIQGRSYPREFPALVCGVQAPGGEIAAIWRIFLDADSCGKLDEDLPPDRDGVVNKAPARLGMASCREGAVRLSEPGPVVFVTEGVEDGLSVLEMYPGSCVHAARSTGNFMVYQPPEGTREVVFLPDGDEAGRKAASRARQRVLERGRPARVIDRCPDGADWNDLLKRQKGIFT